MIVEHQSVCNFKVFRLLFFNRSTVEGLPMNDEPRNGAHNGGNDRHVQPADENIERNPPQENGNLKSSFLVNLTLRCICVSRIMLYNQQFHAVVGMNFKAISVYFRSLIIRIQSGQEIKCLETIILKSKMQVQM